MTEIGISVQIEEKTAEVLANNDWIKEQKFKSSEPVFIHGLIDGEHRGSLSGSLVIEREFVGNTFKEKDRYANLGSVSVYPHEKWRRKGLGSSMIREFEKTAKGFSATKIIGKIGASDLEEESWLPVFYEKLGFTLNKLGEGYSFEKSLTRF